MSSSAVSVLVASSVATAAASSTAAVAAAAGASVAVPSVKASVPSAVETLTRSDVKSVSTLSIDPTVATATRSAAVIFSSTYFWADSTARCTSSGCIELTSKTSVISRRPATRSEVSGAGAAGGSGFAAGGPGARPASAAIFASTPASRSAVSSAGRAFSVISSKVKLAIVCGRPSSRISKSAAVRPRTTAPDLSRTMTSTETTLRLERNTGGRCCAPGPDAVTSTAAAAMEAAPVHRIRKEVNTGTSR